MRPRHTNPPPPKPLTVESPRGVKHRAVRVRPRQGGISIFHRPQGVGRGQVTVSSNVIRLMALVSNSNVSLMNSHVPVRTVISVSVLVIIGDDRPSIIIILTILTIIISIAEPPLTWDVLACPLLSPVQV